MNSQEKHTIAGRADDESTPAAQAAPKQTGRRARSPFQASAWDSTELPNFNSLEHSRIYLQARRAAGLRSPTHIQTSAANADRSVGTTLPA